MDDVAGAILLAGRFMFALFFAMAGWRHIVGGAEMTGYARSVGFPATALAPWPARSGSWPAQYPWAPASGATSVP